MPPHSSLLHIHFTIASTKGDAAKLVRNASLFGATISTPNPDLEESKRQILLSAFSYLKDPNPSIKWMPYQSPSGAPTITAFITMAINENKQI